MSISAGALGAVAELEPAVWVDTEERLDDCRDLAVEDETLDDGADWTVDEEALDETALKLEDELALTSCAEGAEEELAAANLVATACSTRVAIGMGVGAGVGAGAHAAMAASNRQTRMIVVGFIEFLSLWRAHHTFSPEARLRVPVQELVVAFTRAAASPREASSCRGT